MKFYLAFLLLGFVVGEDDTSSFLSLAHNFSNQSIFLMDEEPIYPGPGSVLLPRECREKYTQVMRTFNVGTRVDFRRRKLSNIWKRVLDMCADISPTVRDCFDNNATKVDDSTALPEGWDDSLLVLSKIRRDLTYRMAITDLIVNSYQINTNETIKQLKGKPAECIDLYWNHNDEVILKVIQNTRTLVKTLRRTFNEVKKNRAGEISAGEHGYPPLFQLASACWILTDSGVMPPNEAIFQVDNCIKALPH